MLRPGCSQDWRLPGRSLLVVSITPGVSAVAIVGETVVGGWGDVAEGMQRSVLSDSGVAWRQPLTPGLESRPSCGAGVVELGGWLVDSPVGRRWAQRVSIGFGCLLTTSRGAG